ncbi:hypothetical protein DM02DRAFT_629355 [Periconia macrospinosa]|uniref:Uncharacterized protein n=1 Tax=Periconia macrospinosa TaxID=97972 RepID=A0A2V1DMW0_9PLEO|nr:hypothetical protein DM02DRAFT_629355 [Periconia macrospinosa]
MDPLTAVGLASNVVQFVDFACKVTTEGVKIYRGAGKKGEWDEHDTLESLTESLQEHNKALQGSINGQHQPQSTLSQTDRELLRMCEECQSMTVRFLSALRRLRSSRVTVWSSFTDALKTVWSEGDISKMRQTLESYRQQITLYLLASVRDEIRSFQLRQVSRDQDLLVSVKDTRVAVETFFDNVARQQLWQEEITRAIHDDYAKKPPRAASAALPAVQMQRQLTEKDTKQFHDDLLQWICFSELDYRYEKITEAYEETFEWVFRPPPKDTWSDYTKWLENPNEPLYWITGKPAAGKSTLMKFIFNDKRTYRHLEQWAQGKTLIVSAFYFWNSGSAIQMSEEGMARTLLYETIRQAPELWSTLFPHKMEEYVVFGSPWRQPPTWNEIMKAFRLLVEGAGDYKLFFFIDGLDEFGASHEKLVTLINSLVSPHVKTCVSSRPWNVFEDGFQQRPSLRLEDITYQDIRHFVSSRFAKNRGFCQRRLLDERYADKLIDNITKKASGVFLWVTLVTDSLLDGLSDGERLEELQERLDALPADLETLFWKVLTRLDAKHLVHTSEFLQILRASLLPLNLLTLSFADEPNPDVALKYRIGVIPPQEANARAQIVSRRLNACCKGLIESKPTPGRPLYEAKIGFLHRTVKDYVERVDVWPKFLEMTNKTFNPYTRLFASTIVTLKMSSNDIFENYSGSVFWEIVECGLTYAVNADRTCAQNLQPRFLDELDKAANHLSLTRDDFGRTFVDKFAHTFHLPVTHWTGTRSSTFLCKSFFHLALQYGLKHYLEFCLEGEETLKPKPETLTHGLFVALLHDRDDSLYLTDDYIDPDDRISLLLKHGANPNAKFEDILLHFGGQPGAFSPWEVLLQQEERQNDIIALSFLDSGADPNIVKRNAGSLVYKRAKRLSRHKSSGWRLSFGSVLRSKKHQSG